MAKNIIITPSPGGGTLPSIDFQGLTSGTIKLEVRDDGSLLVGGATETNILSLYDEAANPVRVPSISLEDSNASHHLKIVAGSNLTANRTFTLSTGDAARALDISAADVTISSFGATIVDDADASAARTTLGVAIGTNVQAYNSNLDLYAAITPSANVQTILSAADYAAIRTALSLVIGTNVQAYDADLTIWAGLTPSAYFQTLVDDADASTARGTLGLGTSATVNTGTSGTVIPLLDGTNTWSAAQTINVNAATQLTVTRTDAGTAGAMIDLYHDSSSPANADVIFSIRALGKDNAGNQTVYGRLRHMIADTTDGSEDGQWVFNAMVAGSDTTLLSMAGSTVTYMGNTVWHAGNDGSGSGLDADTIRATTPSAYGLTLIDDADASTARGTLGLGTSATVNTGTSGATIPLLNGANTWSAAQIISVTAAGTVLTLTSTDAGATTGPDLLLYRDSASPAASDIISTITFQGRDSAANAQTYLALKGTITDPTSTSEDATLEVQSVVAGTVATRLMIGGGVYHPSATGTDKGNNTLNFGTIYQNNIQVANSGANTDITSVYLNNTGLKVKDTDASHGLSIVPGSNLTADRTLTITTGDAARTLDISGGSVTISAYGATLTDDADASTARTTLGLGTSATVNTGTSGATIPLLNGNNTYSGTSTFSSTVTLTGTNAIKHATQSSLILQSSGGTNSWGIGRSIGNADGNDFYIYDYVNTFSRLSFTGADAITTTITGKTDSIVTSAATSGYGAFYPKGSGTNNAYIFLGNATNAERARIVVDNSRNLGISVDGGTTNSIYIPSTGNTVLTGGANGGASVTASSGYTVLNVTGASTNQAFILLNNGTGERARIWADNSRNLAFSTDSGSTSHLSISSTGVITANGNTVWHAGNDGSGSGLDADLLDGINSTAVGAGKQGIWVPAAAIWPRTTTGCAALAQLELSTNKNNWPYLAFDATTTEYAQFNLYSNKQFSTSTFTFIPVWTHPSTTTNFGVVWQLSAVGRSDTDAGDVAFGTAVSSTDTGGTTSTIYKGPESSAVTVSTLAAEDVINFQINRLPSDASDTMAVDAYLLGIMLFVTTTVNTDT